jgi:hypothetical protein
MEKYPAEDMGQRTTTKINIEGRVYDNVDWIHQAPDMDQWWALVKTLMRIRFPQFKAIS